MKLKIQFLFVTLIFVSNIISLEFKNIITGNTVKS